MNSNIIQTSQENSLENELEALLQESLTRLEWKKITFFLSHFATFSHTKEMLNSLSPWNLTNSSEFYLNFTKEMMQFFEKGLKLSLENFNLESFEKTLLRGALLSVSGLYNVSIVLKLASTLHSFAKENGVDENSQPNLFAQCKALKPHHSLLQKLQKSVNEQGEILPTASPELYEAHKKCANAKRKITENLEQLLKNSTIKNALQDSTWMLKDGRYVLPIRTDRKNDVDGIARGLSQTGATIFIEPKILATEQAALEKAQLEIEIEEHKVIKLLSSECHLIHLDILQTVSALTLLDEINARTQFASVLAAAPCTMGTTLAEEISGKSIKYYFENAKHPLFILEKKMSIANNLELAEANILVLSGPNAGGKTVVLKTVGVFVLMAKCGLFLPCENAKCLEYDKVFVLLGDRQNREEDLSTFSGHLDQIKKIMNYCDDKTLVLLDEGFVGTDPAAGVALARSVLEFFAEKKSTVIITTHFSSLKTLASEDARFCNASMEFEAKNLRPTYKLLNGIPGQSYALELCERMGISPNIISVARKYYGSEAQRMENILRDLEEQKFTLTTELKQQQTHTAEIQKELANIKHTQMQLQELKDTLVETYRTKLTKRFNAFNNRLEIRERQFAAHKQHNQDSPDNNSSSQDNTTTIENDVMSVRKNTLLAREEYVQGESEKIKVTRGSKLTSFEDLAKIKLETSPRSTPLHEDTMPNKFRQPRQMTHRALIDEAQESLDVLNKSFDYIEEDLDNNISQILKTETKIKHHVDTSKPTHIWKKGERVKSEKFREVGQILKEADNKGLVECQFGPIKVKLHSSQLMTIAQAANQSTTKQPIIKQTISKQEFLKQKAKIANVTNHDIPTVLPHPGNTVDLRGQTVDEALSRLEISLDKMWRNEIPQVVIIHGHGFGRVKEGVRKYLETASYELSFRPGRQGEGGDGVTVVEFEN